MGNTGFDTSFFIRRKRNLYSIQFLTYLNGENSTSAEWPDSEDTAIDPQNDGSALLAPFGYLAVGAEYLTGNLGVDAATITEFTIGAVLVRDESTNTEGIVQGLFGDTHYPRIYFNGTTLNAKVRLDGNIKTVAIANVDTYIKPGHPAFIVFRGSASTGIEVLINGISRGTQTDTGTAFDVGSGDFKLCADTNLSYYQVGALRGFFACASKLTDAQITAWSAMLDYEGYVDMWRDNFAKWTGSESMSSGVSQLIATPYQGTVTNGTVTMGFEEKDTRDTAYASITAATGSCETYVSLQLGSGTKNITGAQAKKLPGVTAGETITIYGEIFIDSLNGNREASLQLEFYNESGTRIGSTTDIPVLEAGIWEQKKETVTVPATATRANFYLKTACGVGETVQSWIAHIRIAR